MLIPPPAEDGRIAARMRFEDPYKFLEFHDKQLARGLVGIRHDSPVEVGAPLLIVISPPDAPDRLQLAGRVERCEPRSDGRVRLRVRIRPDANDRGWISAYVAGLRAGLSRAAATSNDPMTAIELDAVGDVLELARRMDGVSYYTLLGVDRHAPPERLRRQYVEQLSLIRLGDDAGHDVRRAAAAVHRRLAEAYGVLRHPRLRAAYDAGLRGPAPRLRYEDGLPTDARAPTDEAGGLGQRYWRMARDVLERSRSAPHAVPKAAEEALRLLRVAQLFAPDDVHITHAMQHVRALRGSVEGQQRRETAEG